MLILSQFSHESCSQELKTYAPRFQEPDRVKGLLNIWYLLPQTDSSSLGIDLHELIFADHHKFQPRVLIIQAQVHLRDHLLKILQNSFHLHAARDIVFDIIDKWGGGDATRV